MKEKIEFCSSLEKNDKEELKNLLFFNSAQIKVKSGILSSIEKYGLPQIIESRGNLRVKTAKIDSAQNLFAVYKENGHRFLAGVVLFFRESLENITILHIAIHEDFSLNSTKSGYALGVKFIEKLKKIARSLKGVKHLTIYYQKGQARKIPV